VWPLNVVIKTGIFAINLEGKSYMTRPLRRIIDGSVIAFVLVLALSATRENFATPGIFDVAPEAM
jgi:hypothetical protein